MLFNSLEFLIFFPAIVVLYYKSPQRFAWVTLLLASYFFYMWWRAPYVVLILASTAVDYKISRLLTQTEQQRRRRHLLLTSLTLNLGLLAFFKYSRFFAASLSDLLAAFGIHASIPSSGMLLPVGISFYTLQTLSYTIEVFKKNTKPEPHVGIFALYVIFFPQLVAGPIERPQDLMPQLKKRAPLQWSNLSSGVRLMLWGGFQKVVIADQLASGVDYVYGTTDGGSGPLVLIGTYLFAFQIYCDFSGYSNIAIGAARVLGITLRENFARPYFATSFRVFWQRWHISLSTWFRDYLYIPLGGNRLGPVRTYANLLIVFLVSGLWHGANWTYVAWGGVHGIFLIMGIQMRKLAAAFPLPIPTLLKKAVAIVVVFHLVCFSWILFRSASIDQAAQMLETLFSWKNSDADFAIPPLSWPLTFLGLSVLLFVDTTNEWLPDPASFFRKPLPAMALNAGVFLLILWIALYGVFDKQEFIYWKF